MVSVGTLFGSVLTGPGILSPHRLTVVGPGSAPSRSEQNNGSACMAFPSLVDGLLPGRLYARRGKPPARSGRFLLAFAEALVTRREGEAAQGLFQPGAEHRVGQPGQEAVR